MKCIVYRTLFVYLLLFMYSFLSIKATTVSYKNNMVLSPIDCGAIPNDNIDDSKAFQKCLNEAKKRNGTIIIPSGRYIIAEELIIEETTNLVIEGRGATLIKPERDGSNMFYGNYNRGITIRDLNFEGNRPDDFKEQWPRKMNACAILGRSSGIRFENCSVKDFHYGVCFGTSTENGYDVWVENCRFENNGTDIDLYGKPAVHIRGNVSHNCKGHSIQIEPPYKRVQGYYDYTSQPQIDALSIGNIISENVIVGCGGTGVIIFGGCEDISVTSNQIINYGASGIFVKEGAANVSIQGNIISNSTQGELNERPWTDAGAGIVVSNVKNAVVIGNIVSHANTGVYLSGANGCLLTNNKISDSKDAGICMYNSTKCTASNNIVDNYNLDKSWWGNSGMVIYNSRDVRISSSTISDTQSNAHAIFSLESEHIEVKDVIGYGFKTSLTYPARLEK